MKKLLIIIAVVLFGLLLRNHILLVRALNDKRELTEHMQICKKLTEEGRIELLWEKK